MSDTNCNQLNYSPLDPRLKETRLVRGYLSLSLRGHVGTADAPNSSMYPPDKHTRSAENIPYGGGLCIPLFRNMNVSCLSFQVVAIKIQTLERMPSPNFNFIFN